MDKLITEKTWEFIIRRDSSLVNIRGWRGLAGCKCIWRQTIEEARTQCGLHTTEEEGRGGIVVRIYTTFNIRNFAFSLQCVSPPRF